MTAAYPLQWPDGLPRTTSHASSAFKTSLPTALDNVSKSLQAFGRDSGKAVSNIVLSSNVTLGQSSPTDPGVAAWFLWDGEQRCFAVDRYPKVQDNLQAIHHIIEARRTEMRHGGLHVVRQTFKGFTALPPPERWWDILGIPETTNRAGMPPTARPQKPTIQTSVEAARIGTGSAMRTSARRRRAHEHGRGHRPRRRTVARNRHDAETRGAALSSGKILAR